MLFFKYRKEKKKKIHFIKKTNDGKIAFFGQGQPVHFWLLALLFVHIISFCPHTSPFFPTTWLLRFFFFWRFQSPIFTSTCFTVDSPKLLLLPHHLIGIKQNWQSEYLQLLFLFTDTNIARRCHWLFCFCCLFVFCWWLCTKVQGQTQISSLSIQRRWFQPTSWMCMGVAVAWLLSESCIFIAARVTFASQALKSLLLYG